MHARFQRSRLAPKTARVIYISLSMAMSIVGRYICCVWSVERNIDR